MASPFVGEIKPFGGNFAPQGWALCDGSLISIAQNTALFSLIGTYYGGNGTTNFALPDLRGRLPVNQGPNDPIGVRAGVETVTLSLTQIPAHTHGLACNGSPSANLSSPSGNLPGKGLKHYRNLTPDTNLRSSLLSTGSGQAHANSMPTLAVTYIIATQGVYPPRP